MEEDKWAKQCLMSIHSSSAIHPRICDIGDYYRSAVEFFQVHYILSAENSTAAGEVPIC